MIGTCDKALIQDRGQRAGVLAPDAIGHLAVLVFCGAVLAASVILKPQANGLSLAGYRWPFYCWLHETTGVKCALCGMSRSFCALAHGQWQTAVQFHRLGPAVFALFGLQIPYRSYALAVGSGHRAAWLRWLHLAVVTLVGIAVFANWIVYLGGLAL